MKVLVTGGAGFIGSQYVRSVLSGEYPEFEGAELTVVDKLTYAGNIKNLPVEHERLSFIQGDICDPGLMLRTLPGHDAVVHFAAESHVDRSLESGAEFVRTNVLGTQNLLEACVQSDVVTFVHVSTDEVYGSIPEGSWTEQQALLPNSPYAASKAGSDLAVRAYWRTHGLDVRITRCSNNYGPHQHPEKLIPRFITNLINGKPVPLYGNGGNVREWVHVQDHCAAIQLVLTKGKAGEIYNIGGGTELTNLEITETLISLCGADRNLLRFVEDRKGHDLRYSIDDSKIRSELGYAPHRSFDKGLAAVVDWYRRNADHWSQPNTRYAGSADETGSLLESRSGANSSSVS